MKKNRLKEIVSELQGASKMHLKQSKEIQGHIDSMKAPTKQTTAGDVVGFAGNFLKGLGGIAASMLSTTTAYGGQSSPEQQREEMRSHGDLSKKEFDRLNAKQDGGPLPFPKTEPVESVAKARYKCWKGYKAKGKKKSPSGKRTKSGKIKMVNNCVKK